MQTADQPAVLLLRQIVATCEPFPVHLHFGQREERVPLGVKNHGGNIVIEQAPFPFSVGSAGQKDLEGVVPGHADSASAIVPEQRLHFRDPLRVGRAAQPKPMGKHPRPIFPRPQVWPLDEPLPPQILRTFLAVGIVRIPPQPRRQCLLLIVLRPRPRHPLVDPCLRLLQPLEVGAGEFPRIPGMVRGNLRIPHVRPPSRGPQNH